MKLLGRDGRYLSLMPIAYLYPQRTGFPEDSQWLADPAPKISEVEQLASWLQTAPSGEVPVLSPEPDVHCPPGFRFEDPSLAFSLAGRQGTRSRLRIHCSGGCAPPPGAPGEVRDHCLGHVVEMSIAADDLIEAARDLLDELAAFPMRI